MISKLKILVLFFVAAPAVASAVNCHSGGTQPTIALCQQQDQQRSQQQSIPQQVPQQAVNCHSGGTQPSIALCQQQDRQRSQQQPSPQQVSQQAVNCHSGGTQPTIALCQQQDQQRSQQQSIPQQASQQVINCHSGGTQPSIALCQQQDRQRSQQQSSPQQGINCQSGGTQPTIALCQQQDSRAAAQKPPQTASQSSATSDALRLQENQNKLLNSVVEQATAAVRRKDYQGAANLINSLPPSLQETAKDGVFGGATPVDMLPYFMPIGRVATGVVKTAQIASGIVRSTALLKNQLPHLLENELKIANDVGFKAFQIGEPAFIKAANEGTLKFVVLPNGIVILGNKFIRGVEISHAVLSRGADVISAGEIEIATNGIKPFFAGFVPHSGHYLNGATTETTKKAIELAAKAFENYGIIFK